MHKAFAIAIVEAIGISKVHTTRHPRYTVVASTFVLVPVVNHTNARRWQTRNGCTQTYTSCHSICAVDLTLLTPIRYRSLNDKLMINPFERSRAASLATPSPLSAFMISLCNFECLLAAVWSSISRFRFWWIRFPSVRYRAIPTIVTWSNTIITLQTLQP